jgi:hypothetical protein
MYKKRLGRIQPYRTQANRFIGGVVAPVAPLPVGTLIVMGVGK